MSVNDQLPEGQARVLAWLIRQEIYVAPVTFREISAAMGFTSPSGPAAHLKALEKKGYIKRGPGARQIRILKHPEGEP